jgi:hypothetical protein
MRQENENNLNCPHRRIGIKIANRYNRFMDKEMDI